MSRIIPYGIPGTKFTTMANLMRSYNTVSNLKNDVPLFFSRIESDDAAEMKENVGGYYYMCFELYAQYMTHVPYSKMKHLFNFQ